MATAMPRMRVEAREARRAIAGVIVLSSTQPGMTLHSSGEAGKIAACRLIRRFYIMG
jgi:hypothetical protein